MADPIVEENGRTVRPDRLFWTLTDQLDCFDLGESDARLKVWRGREGLYLGKPQSVVFLRDEIRLPAYRLEAEVAIPGQVGFIGLVFGAKDAENYELVYLAPVEIQYDPIMNGSMTWQIYNGPRYQSPLPDTTGEWWKLAVEVQGNRAAVYLGDSAEPKLVLDRLKHGGGPGRVGFWNYLPGFIRNFAVEVLEPSERGENEAACPQAPQGTFVTEWLVSQPYTVGEPEEAAAGWTKRYTEENGTLNLNRLHPASQGVSLLARSGFHLSEACETVMSFGFSDRLRLWVNGEEIYEGNWKWDPPSSDGRIRGDMARVPIRWKAGYNTIRAEVTALEPFGWGLSVSTGLPHLSFMVE